MCYTILMSKTKNGNINILKTIGLGIETFQLTGIETFTKLQELELKVFT